MSAIYSGVRAQAADSGPSIVRLTISIVYLNDSIKKVPAVNQFYDTVERLYDFYCFGHRKKGKKRDEFRLVIWWEWRAEKEQ